MHKYPPKVARKRSKHFVVNKKVDENNYQEIQANNGLFKHVIGQDDTVREGEYKVNLLGEYNIGGDEFLVNYHRPCRWLIGCGMTTDNVLRHA